MELRRDASTEELGVFELKPEIDLLSTLLCLQDEANKVKAHN